MANAVFVDWLTASQHHPEGGLPILVGGVTVWYDAAGNPRTERASATRVVGSFDTACRVQCDGHRVYLSGNVGRFGRQDNLFNHGWAGTSAAANRILAGVGLPPFTATARLADGTERRGAVVSRLDLTANYGTGSEAQARAVIRWLSARSVARMKRGNAGDDSVWWANSRHMLKAYIKHVEMLAHGAAEDEWVVQWCKREGVVRVEAEMKKRLLSEMGLNDWGDISDERLESLFEEQTSVLKAVDRSDEPDILAAIPTRSRAYAAAWLAGQDAATLGSRATVFRHAKVLREFGLDILQPRNVVQFPVKVRVVELRPLDVPDWYEMEPQRLRAVS